MEGPTRSTQSNKLLAMCEGILTGKNLPSDLMSLLDEVYQGLDKALDEFKEKVKNQDEEYASKMQDFTDLVLASFDEYRDALDTIYGFFQNQNAQFIREGMEKVIQATNIMLDCVAIYESRALQIGPTSFPLLNMIILLVENFKAGSIAEEEFRGAICNAGEFFIKLADEIEAYKGDKAQNAMEKLKEGYGQFIRGLEKMDEAAEEHNNLMLDEAVDIIHESQEIIKLGYCLFEEELYASQPTESPKTNMLIATVKGVRDSIFPKEFLIENLKRYRDHLDELRNLMEDVESVAGDNEEVMEVVPSTLDGLELAEEACDIIEDYLETGNVANLDKAIENLINSIKMINESKGKYEEIGEREGKINCIRCGAYNNQGASKCCECGAVLPRIAGEQTSSTFALEEGMPLPIDGEFVMTETLQKLLKACTEVRDGKMNFDAFEEFLNQMEDKFGKNLADAEATPGINLESFPEEMREGLVESKKLAEDNTELLKEGLEQYLESISIMRQFIENESPQHLVEGLKMAAEASTKVTKVGQISDYVLYQVRKTIEEAQREDEVAKTLENANESEEEEEGVVASASGQDVFKSSSSIEA